MCIYTYIYIHVACVYIYIYIYIYTYVCKHMFATMCYCLISNRYFVCFFCAILRFARYLFAACCCLSCFAHDLDLILPPNPLPPGSEHPPCHEVAMTVTVTVTITSSMTAATTIIITIRIPQGPNAAKRNLTAKSA